MLLFRQKGETEPPAAGKARFILRDPLSPLSRDPCESTLDLQLWQPMWGLKSNSGFGLIKDWRKVGSQGKRTPALVGLWGI